LKARFGVVVSKSIPGQLDSLLRSALVKKLPDGKVKLTFNGDTSSSP
jgi:hypothetical protein